MRESYTTVPGTRYGTGRAPYRAPATADCAACGGLPLPPSCTNVHLPFDCAMETTGGVP